MQNTNNLFMPSPDRLAPWVGAISHLSSNITITRWLNVYSCVILQYILRRSMSGRTVLLLLLGIKLWENFGPTFLIDSWNVLNKQKKKSRFFPFKSKVKPFPGKLRSYISVSHCIFFFFLTRTASVDSAVAICACKCCTITVWLLSRCINIIAG